MRRGNPGVRESIYKQKYRIEVSADCGARSRRAQLLHFRTRFFGAWNDDSGGSMPGIGVLARRGRGGDAELMDGGGGTAVVVMPRRRPPVVVPEPDDAVA